MRFSINTIESNYMRIRTVYKVKPSLSIESFDIPEEDIEMFTHHLRDCDDSGLVVIEGTVVHRGRFDDELIKRLLPKIKALVKKVEKSTTSCNQEIDTKLQTV